MQITIELSNEDAKHLSSYCILRGIKGALHVVPDDWDYYDELLDAAERYERIRTAIVQEVFKQQRAKP